MSERKLKLLSRLFLGAAVGVCVLGIGYAYRQHVAVEEVLSERGHLEDSLKRNDEHKVVVDQLRREFEQMKIELDELAKAREVREAMYSQRLTGVESKEVDDWMDRTYRLGQFLEENEKYRIQGMESLTPYNWLKATNSRTLKTEADYREVLSDLRITIKGRVGESLKDALREYKKEFPDGVVQDVSDVEKYLSEDIDKGVLDLYRISSEEESRGMNFVFVEKTQVDALWGTSSMVSGDYALLRNSNRVRGIEEAFSKYITENGEEPVEGDALIPYLKNDRDLDILPEVFRAMTTVVEF